MRPQLVTFNIHDERKTLVMLQIEVIATGPRGRRVVGSKRGGAETYPWPWPEMLEFGLRRGFAWGIQYTVNATAMSGSFRAHRRTLGWRTKHPKRLKKHVVFHVLRLHLNEHKELTRLLSGKMSKLFKKATHCQAIICSEALGFPRAKV